MKTVKPTQSAAIADRRPCPVPSPQLSDCGAEATLDPKVIQAHGLKEPDFSEMKAFMAYLEQLPPGTRSKEDIDRYVAQERASWD